MKDFNVVVFFAWYLAFVASTTLHEFAHAFVAWRGGDSTAADAGTMTADPTPHILRSPFGMVIVPIFTFVTAGWVMGWASVPYNSTWASRHPKRAAWMSLAGPAMNFGLAFIALIAIKVLLSQGIFTPNGWVEAGIVGVAPEYAGTLFEPAAMLLSIVFFLNVLLGVFNLLPVPPLDGAGVLAGFFPKNPLTSLYREVQMGALIGLLVAWSLFNRLAGPLTEGMLWLVYRW